MAGELLNENCSRRGSMSAEGITMREGFFDLRGALELLADKNELTEVTGEVDWNLELGALTREVYRRRGPALLYENIKDYNRPDSRFRKLAVGLFGS
ncbi:MAG: hypothetical protein ACREP6_06265, partial [Candidatus Binataceae bacterium]